MHLLLSRLTIRPRIFGGFAIVLAFLIFLAAFALNQASEIGGTVGSLVASADGDAGMARVHTSLLVANGTVERFIRTRNVGDRSDAAKALDVFSATLDEVNARFGRLPAIMAAQSGLKSSLLAYRSAFDALSVAIDRLRNATAKTETIGAELGLQSAAISVAIANETGAAHAVNPLRLPAVADAVRIAVMRYTTTQAQGDADDASLAFQYAQAAISDSQAEAAAMAQPRLKTLVASLKSLLTADAATLQDVISAANELRTIQQTLGKTSGTIDAGISAVSEALSAARAQESLRASAAVEQTRSLTLIVAACAVLLGAALAWIIGASVSGPVSRMTRRMQSLAARRIGRADPRRRPA